MGFDFVAIPAIVVICYLVGQAIKATMIDNKWIPIICGAFGGVLGVVVYITGEFTGDILTAIATGIVSGLASTGVNQVYKQLKSLSDKAAKK